MVHRVTEENQGFQGSRSVNINQKEPNQKLYQNLQSEWRKNALKLEITDDDDDHVFTG